MTSISPALLSYRATISVDRTEVETDINASDDNTARVAAEEWFLEHYEVRPTYIKVTRQRNNVLRDNPQLVHG
jgi:hypothetical protein